MKKVYLIIGLFFLSLNLLATDRTGFSTSYPKDYKDWANAFVSGNGKMGIMVFGNPLHETVIFNDRRFNLAQTTERSFATVSSADVLQIRKLCAEGKFEEANALAVKTSEWKDGGEGNRHPGFAMFIDMIENGDISNYKRLCDFRTGEIKVSWTDKRGHWERKSFVSQKENVVVQELKAPGKSILNCEIRLDTVAAMNFPVGMKLIRTANESELRFQAYYAGNKEAGYEGVTRVVTAGGKIVVAGNKLIIRNAKSVLLLTRTEKYYQNAENTFSENSVSTRLKQLPVSYEKLLREHIQLHQTIYDRVHLDLNASEADRAKTNDELLLEQKKSEKPLPALWERLFNSGRYIFLSSSSELAPPDLLGIWTGDCNAGWGGYYHLDANLNLQIAGGNTGNMPEAVEGYFHIIESWQNDFGLNAQKLLGCRGMLACGNTPGNRGLMASINTYYPYQYATGEAPWLLYPMWEHYQITGDTVFLKQRLFPLLQDMGWFYEDFLTEKDSVGQYILAASVSPENQPSNRKVSLLNNCAFDVAGARFALSALLKTCEILNEKENYAKWENLFTNLPDYVVNKDGAISEWGWPELNDNYNHRHSSQLIMVYPYRELSPEHNSTLFNAAAETLKRKDEFNYENAGHGLLHSALIAAGLKNAESVGNKLLRLTREGFYYNSLCSAHYVNNGVFCTDVCNTFPAVIIEMLVSTSPGELELLPALPANLASGKISGIKGRNRITIDTLSWDQPNKTIVCSIHSDIDQQVNLICRKGIQQISGHGVSGTFAPGQISCQLNLKAGQYYALNIQTN